MMKKIIIGIVIVIAVVFITKSLMNKEPQTGDVNAKLPAGSSAPADVEPLKNVTWVWEKTIMSDGKIVAPNKKGAFSILLDNQGTVLGRTDCNGFSGGYEFGSDGAFKTGPYAMTIKHCEGTQENLFVDSLAQTGGYMVDTNGNLVLLLRNDSGSMIFKK